MKFRAERVSKLIREELAKIVMREIEFPEGALATLTEVEVDKKLEHAKVKVSVIPASYEAEVMEMLGGQAGELQHLLLKRINIKPMPRIMFAVDRGLENAARVEKLLDEGKIE